MSEQENIMTSMAKINGLLYFKLNNLLNKYAPISDAMDINVNADITHIMKNIASIRSILPPCCIDLDNAYSGINCFVFAG